MSYATHDALADVLRDLWDHEELVNQLESKDAISEGWPVNDQSRSVVVRIQPITETSSNIGPNVEKTFRFQVSVVASDRWRQGKARPMFEMLEIMDAVADRLDVSSTINGAEPGEIAAGSWQEVDGNRLANIQDWRITIRPRR